jgi:hypothetical protein
MTDKPITKHVVRDATAGASGRDKPGITRQLTVEQREQLVAEMTEPEPAPVPTDDDAVEIIVESPADDEQRDEE